MKKITLFLLAILMCVGTTMAQKITDPINNDPNVKIGKLANGMTYYIRENKKPENRAEFWLLVNAGSNQENDDQLGLAHFTEHMGFNGIKGYPGNTMLDELQKVGVSFGREINAYTSFDETVYQLTMPTDNPTNIALAFNVLKGWANDYLLDNKEIDAERGIIIEEYRMGLGASDRMLKKWLPVVANGSRYGVRLPIGTLEVLQNFKHQTIKDFYADWYRPDLQAIVIVGDINAVEMEKLIIEKFSKIKPRKNAPEKLDFPIPPNKEPLIVVCTDKEAAGNTVMMLRKFPRFTMKTVGDYKTKMTHTLYNIMYEGRLSEMQQNPNCPFLGAGVDYSNFIGTTDAYGAQISAKDNQIEQSMKVIMQEDYRVLKHGFLESELKRAKEELLNNAEIAANEVDKTESNRFANQYLSHFLENDPIPGAKRVYNYAKKYLAEITLEEVNALAKQWITKENINVVVMLPEKEGITVPTEKEILAILNDKTLENVEAYIDTYKEQEIVEKENLKAGKIASEKTIPEIDAKEIVLSNGVIVYLKKTDFKNDEILFIAESKGGLCLYDEKDLASGYFACDFVDRAGIANLDFTSLQKKMKGKRVELTPDLSVFGEKLSGSTTPKDLEFFFQYLNAFFTHPRYDETVYELVTKETIDQLKMISVMPMYRFLINMIKEVTQNDMYGRDGVTNLIFTEEFIKSANYQRAFEIYKERFANPAEFAFTFVGNFDEKLMREYLELYLGSLPEGSQCDNIKTDVVKGFPKTTIQKDVFAGTEEQSFVGIAFANEFEWNEGNKAILSVLRDAMDIELVTEIREKMSGVYSPACIFEYNKLPHSHFSMIIFFGCAPDNTDNLSNAVFNILKNLQANGPSEETMLKVKQQLIKQRETQLKTNNWWNFYISTRVKEHEDFNLFADFEKNINAVSAIDVAKFLQANFNIEHFVRLNMYPEKK